MINAFPIVGWFLSLLFCWSLAVPFWYCWTACGLGHTYFDFLPAKYQAVPFWHCVGLFTVIPILKSMLIPKLFHVNQTSNNSNGEGDDDKGVSEKIGEAIWRRL